MVDVWSSVSDDVRDSVFVVVELYEEVIDLDLIELDECDSDNVREPTDLETVTETEFV